MFVSQKSTKEQDQSKVVFFLKKVCKVLKIYFDIVVFYGGGMKISKNIANFPY